jgi:hypothetical protein
VKAVVDEHGRRRACVYLQPEDGFEPWAPQPGYLGVLWCAYGGLGFDVEPLALAGVQQRAPHGPSVAPTRAYPEHPVFSRTRVFVLPLTSRMPRRPRRGFALP